MLDLNFILRGFFLLPKKGGGIFFLGSQGTGWSKGRCWSDNAPTNNNFEAGCNVIRIIKFIQPEDIIDGGIELACYGLK